MNLLSHYAHCLVLPMLLIASSCASLMPQTSSSSVELASDITKSKQDTNQYRSLTLDNQMQVLLVSSDDPTAAAVLDVRVGSLSNPVAFPGLAHFLEHLLFLGTKKYPEPQSYQQYISTNGGNYNASTGAMNTKYYFAINSKKLEPALDRLAQFFIAPLFGRKHIDRELSIIESEYQRNRNSESRALYSVSRDSYNAEHPASRFSMGNQEVLLRNGKEALYHALLKLYQEQYSANRMNLVIHGNQSLDKLEEMARKYFSPVINTAPPKIEVSQPLYKPESLPMLLQIKPKSEIYSLDYTFPIAKEDQSEYVKSAAFLSHLLGHESEGSLLDYLRNKGWAEGLSAGGFEMAGSHFINISISMTPEGNAYTENIHRAVFFYIHLIAEQGLEQWRYDELQSMARMNFDFQEPSTALGLSESMARAMHYVPVKDVLSSSSLYSGWRKNQVQEMINSLTVDNVRVTHIAPNVAVNRQPKWFDVDYSLSRFDSRGIYAVPATLDGLAQLHLPERNSFIPQPLAEETTTKPPYKIDHDQITIWHAPKAARQRASIVFGVLTKRHRNNSTTVRALKKIYLHALQQKFANQVYRASLAGLHAQVYEHLSGITVRVTGYSNKLPLFFDQVIEQVGKWELSKKDFERYRLEILRASHNQVNNTPSQRVGSRMASYLIKQVPHREQQIATLESLQYTDWQQLVSSMKAEPKDLVLLGSGEISKDQLLQAAQKVEDVFPGEPIRLKNLTVQTLNDQPSYIIEPATLGQSTDVLELYFQVPGTGYKKQVAVMMLANYLHSPFFHQLRTERKLGYQASVFPMITVEQPGIAFIVESDTVSALSLTQEFQSFIDRQKKAVALLDQETFVPLRQGLIANLQRRDKGILAESLRLWYDLNRGNTRFDTREQLIKTASEYTIEDFRQAFKEYIVDNKRRLWALSQVEKREKAPAIIGNKVHE